MMNTELLVEHVAAYLETDPRFVNENCGSFEWYGHRCYFEIYLFYVVLEINDVTLEVELY